MDAALAALDRGVRALFSEPGAALAASSAHPLCECMLQHAPPPDWRHLQRFPVLKRHVLTQFRVVAVEVEKQPQTPRKRKKRSLLLQSGGAEDFRSVCVASLCQKLAQCGLLTLGDAEFVETLVDMQTLDVLRRVIGGKLLPLRLRMLLLGFALQRVEKKAVDAAEQSWIREVCEKILEEAREATATGGSKEPPSKKVRTRSGGSEAVGAEKDEKCCGFCREGVTAVSLRSKSGGWDFLVGCTHRVAKTLEKSGESYATNEALVALSAFWDSLPVVAQVPRDFDAESQLFTQRVEKVLHESLATNTGSTENAAHAKSSGISGGDEPRTKAAADATEMDAFFQYWADEMLLKYDYIDRGQCESVLATIQCALQGSDAVQ
ncbi:uncharacterized protein IUM83_02385 [Phytophthora cinnamomi]|uniref:uncharacterized protein n=1 Tax=Phytophthora cinnamomi TaxID=4785 RepID=UPI003559E5C1|nr:hypothetical protein IUM83_02385 [Phytophthora cinnamomi]